MNQWKRGGPAWCAAALILTVGVQLTMAAVPGAFDVRQHGATGDGRSLDTAAINKAIEACSAAGGGQVVFPPGDYLSGTVHLKSNVTLVLEAGATLVGSKKLADYQNLNPPAVMPEAKWTRWHRALIVADGAENIAITGKGTIDGNKVFDPRGEEKMRGPHTILLGNCRKVTIRDVSIRDSANYAILFELTDDVEIRNLTITGGWDGVHFRGWRGQACRNVTIADCRMLTGDDSIAGRYWDNVRITNCVLNSSCNCVRLIGPATRLVIEKCRMYGPGEYPHRTSKRVNTLAALNLQPGSWDGTQGRLDDVTISDITIENVSTPFHFVLNPGNTAGRIVVSRVRATGVYLAASSVESWAETRFEEVAFRDVSIEYAGGGKPEATPRPVRAPGTDARPLPAWGFYARNVTKLTFENVRLSVAKDDARPAVVCDGVKALVATGLKIPKPADAFRLDRVRRIQARDSDFAVVEPRVADLVPVAEEPGGKLRAGKPYSIKVSVENGEREGLGKIEVSSNGQADARWLWLRPKEKKEIVFRDLSAPAAGTHEMRCGDVRRELVVEP
ncbi:MAG: glycoside hydrolase family 28 protein [Pirellulales bacterium]